MAGQFVIVSAPSGSGKSSIVNYLLKQNLRLGFSVSATSRKPRQTEQHGREYYFLSPEEFQRRIAAGDFLEYEEVYAGTFYGTLKSETERILSQGERVIFDVDVAGGCHLKDYYGNRALSVFIQPPDLQCLRERLQKRGTETCDVIERRLTKVPYELSFAERFDVVILNDQLPKAQAEALHAVKTFLER